MFRIFYIVFTEFVLIQSCYIFIQVNWIGTTNSFVCLMSYKIDTKIWKKYIKKAKGLNWD